MIQPSEFLSHRGVPFQIDYEAEGLRRWTVLRDGTQPVTGQATQTGQLSSFRHAVAAAKAVIDAVEDW